MKLIFVIIFHFGWINLLAQQPKIIAHRGASSIAPENTLAAFSKAIYIGANYYELDVWYSSDDSMMVIHDRTIDRTTNGTGVVNQLTFSQIRQYDAGNWFGPEFVNEKIPTLYEALNLAKKSGKVKVCVHVYETKSTIIPRIVALVEQLGMVNDVVVFSFDQMQVQECKQLNKTIKTLFLVNSLSADLINNALNISANIIGPSSNVSDTLINYAHKLGLEVWNWTVDDSTEMKRLISIGVDGIITDYPQYLVRNSTDIINDTRQRIDFTLMTNYPNPFNSSTIISFNLPERSTVNLEIFNILGERIASLINNTEINSGNHDIRWNAMNIASGLYFAILSVSSKSHPSYFYKSVEKLALMK